MLNVERPFTHSFHQVLFLKHDSADVKDTQKNPAIRTAYNTPRPALRTVIQKEFDLDIQSGEHSSVSLLPSYFKDTLWHLPNCTSR